MEQSGQLGGFIPRRSQVQILSLRLGGGHDMVILSKCELFSDGSHFF